MIPRIAATRPAIFILDSRAAMKVSTLSHVIPMDTPDASTYKVDE
jgi:hypothetical protein